MFKLYNKILIFGNSLILSLKWIYFLIKFKYNYNWMTQTKEGGLYFKEKLLNLGIIGIKLGQYLHTKKEFISEDVQQILSELLTNNIIHSKEDTIRMIDYDSSNFKENIESIEPNVLGSGSLAQVHTCYLKNDTNKYVIKVAHPCIFNLEYEIAGLQYILKIASTFKKNNIDWDSFFQNIIIQSDLNNEAINMQKFYDIYKNYDLIEIPKLIYSNKYFIIMTYCEGVPMNTLDTLSNEYIMATNLAASCFLHTAKKFNLCHGDLHQGNILVKPSGAISLIDFGICNNYALNEQNRDVLYIYKKLCYSGDVELIEELLSLLILKPYTNPELNDIKKIVSKFKSHYNETMEEKMKKVDPNKESINLLILNFLINFCHVFNLKISGEFINMMLQLILLESFANREGKHNGQITLRTFSYMKTDKFFMNELGDYILDFYKLEYDNEPSKRVRLKYP